MNRETIYFKLKEAAAMADVIEAAENGYVALREDSIRDLDEKLLHMIDEIKEEQNSKLSQARKLPA